MIYYKVIMAAPAKFTLILFIALAVSLPEIMNIARSAGGDTPAGAASADPGGGGAAASDPGGGASLSDALRSMGLKLESRNAMSEQFIVDHIQKTPTVN